MENNVPRPDLVDSDPIDFVLNVEHLYATLVKRAVPLSGEEPTLGGKLLYIGELDQRTRALVLAGNIAGAANLTATADVATQKQAIRDGVVDFLVTSLDEALRILKNEVRKRERIAVCVSVAPAPMEREMAERGVQPDLLGSDVFEGDPRRSTSHLTWSVNSAPALWLPKMDALGIECLDPLQGIERRWLRLAPRHLGRMAQNVRALSVDREFASRFIQQVKTPVESGEIGAAVSIQFVDSRGTEQYRFTPNC